MAFGSEPLSVTCVRLASFPVPFRPPLDERAFLQSITDTEYARCSQGLLAHTSACRSKHCRNPTFSSERSLSHSAQHLGFRNPTASAQQQRFLPRLSIGSWFPFYKALPLILNIFFWCLLIVLPGASLSNAPRLGALRRYCHDSEPVWRLRWHGWRDSTGHGEGVL